MRRESRRLLTLGILIVAALGLIVIGGRSGVLRPLISGAMLPLSPAAGLLSDGAEEVTSRIEETEDYDTLQERVSELEHTVAELQVEIVRLREIERDYYRLSGLLDYLDEHPDQNLITGNVIAHDASSYLRWIVINRGAQDGVRVGQPVINELGIVGRVEDVASNAAWVRLANDPGSAINARLQTARGEGTVVGQLQGGLQMQFISQDVNVEEGDLVLTSGLGGTFPPDIVIGQVSSVRKQQAALFQEAEIRPTVDYNRLDLVAVIANFEPVDLSTFDEVIEEQGEEQE